MGERKGAAAQEAGKQLNMISVKAPKYNATEVEALVSRLYSNDQFLHTRPL